ncbi:alanine racemase [Cellvibrio zantedeschiae]|uniref:Alanine racemase n=1 Tax=Cellvibrio zantedeschiae TaxID=1237077 RepID=A0ABQ3AL77_9GAMM|nr:alanine racemase [Cellvibrio zantedeschiae]GGY60738.1 alanine racemase [Cellvibrio zantedeschiae]
MISSTGVLTIDLSAIQSNWLQVAAMLNGRAECAAVVKADAYSVGAGEVAAALYASGCRSFYLATLHEAKQLRQVLPQDTILYVLGGVREGTEAALVELNLIPVLYSLPTINRWLDFCQSREQAFPCAIKLDTGMARLGLTEGEFVKLLAIAPDSPLLNPVLFMSHLACADEAAHPLNDDQLKRFSSAVTKIKTIFPKIKTSLANSSGTFLGEAYHFDMVRIGAALYGINPQPGSINPLQNVIDLKLPVLQIRETEQPSSVGYGATASVKAGTRLAVVAGGYADGINRSLGSAPEGRAAGVEVRAVGRLSMDSCIFDITSVEGDPAYIDVINHELTLDYLMSVNKTLGYEVLTSLGRRYQRRYISSGTNNE